MVFLIKKCALQNQPLKARYKAGNIFVEFILETRAQRLPDTTKV